MLRSLWGAVCSSGVPHHFLTAAFLTAAGFAVAPASAQDDPALGRGAASAITVTLAAVPEHDSFGRPLRTFHFVDGRLVERITPLPPSSSSAGGAAGGAAGGEAESEEGGAGGESHEIGPGPSGNPLYVNGYPDPRSNDPLGELGPETIPDSRGSRTSEGCNSGSILHGDGMCGSPGAAPSDPEYLSPEDPGYVEPHEPATCQVCYLQVDSTQSPEDCGSQFLSASQCGGINIDSGAGRSVCGREIAGIGRAEVYNSGGAPCSVGRFSGSCGSWSRTAVECPPAGAHDCPEESASGACAGYENPYAPEPDTSCTPTPANNQCGTGNVNSNGGNSPSGGGGGGGGGSGSNPSNQADYNAGGGARNPDGSELSGSQGHCFSALNVGVPCRCASVSQVGPCKDTNGDGIPDGAVGTPDQPGFCQIGELGDAPSGNPFSEAGGAVSGESEHNEPLDDPRNLLICSDNGVEDNSNLDCFATRYCNSASAAGVDACATGSLGNITPLQVTTGNPLNSCENPAVSSNGAQLAGTTCNCTANFTQEGSYFGALGAAGVVSQGLLGQITADGVMPSDAVVGDTSRSLCRRHPSHCRQCVGTNCTADVGDRPLVPDDLIDRILPNCDAEGVTSDQNCREADGEPRCSETPRDGDRLYCLPVTPIVDGLPTCTTELTQAGINCRNPDGLTFQCPQSRPIVTAGVAGCAPIEDATPLDQLPVCTDQNTGMNCQTSDGMPQCPQSAVQIDSSGRSSCAAIPDGGPDTPDDPDEEDNESAAAACSAAEAAGDEASWVECIQRQLQAPIADIFVNDAGEVEFPFPGTIPGSTLTTFNPRAYVESQLAAGIRDLEYESNSSRRREEFLDVGIFQAAIDDLVTSWFGDGLRGEDECPEGRDLPFVDALEGALGQEYTGALTVQIAGTKTEVVDGQTVVMLGGADEPFFVESYSLGGFVCDLMEDYHLEDALRGGMLLVASLLSFFIAVRF